VKGYQCHDQYYGCEVKAENHIELAMELVHVCWLVIVAECH
jgi:hypothetical protein